MRLEYAASTWPIDSPHIAVDGSYSLKKAFDVDGLVDYSQSTMPKAPSNTRRRLQAVIPKEALANVVSRVIEEREMTQTEAAMLSRRPRRSL